MVNLVQGRNCDSCTVCCESLKIDILQKAAGTLCKHCVGNGCGIYETRPQVCRTWFCLWRQLDALPPELRPDRSRVLLVLDTPFNPRDVFEQKSIVCRALDDPSTFDTPAVAATIEMLIAAGTYPVWLSFEGRKSLVHPRKEIVAVILNPYGYHSTAARCEASEWLAKYQSTL